MAVLKRARHRLFVTVTLVAVAVAGLGVAGGATAALEGATEGGTDTCRSDSVAVEFTLENANGEPARVFTYGDTMLATCLVINNTGHALDYDIVRRPIVMEVVADSSDSVLSTSEGVAIYPGVVRWAHLASGQALQLRWHVSLGTGLNGLEYSPLPPGVYTLRVRFFRVFRSVPVSLPRPIRFKVTRCDVESPTRP